MSFEYEGDLQVLRNLLTKRDLLLRNDSRHELYQTGCAIQGGGFRCVAGAGVARALHRLNCTHVFDTMLTGSGGTPTGAALLSGQILEASQLYWNEFVSQQSICVGRLFLSFMFRNIYAMDIDYGYEVYRGRNRNGIGLDIDALRRSRTEFYAAATKHDGTEALIDMRTVDDPIRAIVASTAMPGFTRGFVHIGDDYLFDSEGAVVFTATRLFELHPSLTDLLVIMNSPKPKNGEIGSPVPSAYLRSVPKGVRNAFLTKHIRYYEELKKLREIINAPTPSCRVLMLWSDSVDGVGPFTTDSELLEVHSNRTEVFTKNLFAQHEERVAA